MLIGHFIKTFAVILLNAGGVAAGYGFSKLKKPYWAIGYMVCLAFLVCLGCANYIKGLSFVFPFSLITAGRNEFVIIGICTGTMLSTLMLKTEKKGVKAGIVIIMSVVIFHCSLSPFLFPLLFQNKHKNLYTTVRNGVCMQSTGYTCGPAAAVTALHELGVTAKEGDIAIACATTPQSGTQPDSLAQGLSKLYGHKGIDFQYRYFNNIDELKQAGGYTILVVKHSFLVDHYITFLKADKDSVYVGDPLQGRRIYSIKEFENKWKKCGVVCRERGARNAELGTRNAERGVTQRGWE